ncbi:uncharacterized protein [Rutidosis leptorrhynchoides]|uniref:uncharacterized protein n=1 Tax=Rutidosis leptorrhynchoides TaxID=125765 RepID=UPI003A99ACB4
MALYLQIIVISITTLSIAAKELRPSEHGLNNNAEAPETAKAKSPEMSSFFGNGVSSTAQPLPEARNYSDTTWNTLHPSRADHVRKVLIVSSLVFGLAGVVLLAVAGFLFLHRFRNQNQ